MPRAIAGSPTPFPILARNRAFRDQEINVSAATMSILGTIGKMRVQEHSVRGSRREAKFPAISYMVLVFLVPGVLIGAAFAAANTNWFFYHDNYFMLRNAGYSLSLHHADCQVVLTGDSSALTGLDPQTVTKITGLSACNVAEGGTVTVVTGSYPLDTYLQNNAAPEYIVFMFTPSLFRPFHSWNESSSYYEGITYLLRYERNKDTYMKLMMHPRETLFFAAWAANSIVADSVTRLVNPHKYEGIEDPALFRKRRNGLFTFYSAPETSCYRNGLDKKQTVTTDPEWVASLRRKYGVNGTRVIVNVAPVPDCDDMKDVYEQVLKGVHDNQLEVLPIGMFNSQDVHPTLEGAQHISTGVANQILTDERIRTP